MTPGLRLCEIAPVLSRSVGGVSSSASINAKSLLILPHARRGSNPARNDVRRWLTLGAPRSSPYRSQPHPLDAIAQEGDNFHSSARRCSSVVEQRIRNARVVGSIPTTGLSHFSSKTALRLDSRAELPGRLARSIAQHFAPKRNFIAKFLPSDQGRSRALRQISPGLVVQFD